MANLETAILANGNTIKYSPSAIGEGGMKKVFLSEDKSSVICLYKNQSISASDSNRITRLNRILYEYNPTIGTDGHYWQDIFCWITGIVVKPCLGIVTPYIPQNFWFSQGRLGSKKKTKEAIWFIHPKSRRVISPQELGDWRNYMSNAIQLARAVRRLHQAGLAHSDLSGYNVLMDATRGKSLIIDIDSLVVPNLFPPDVLGTKGYFAPEVIKTLHLPWDDSRRQQPSALTDLHALAVLIYQYLFHRHPLDGPKIHPAPTPELQESLEMGKNALFIEHPTDKSNRPTDLKISYQVSGTHLVNLFNKAFIEGLHQPEKRPSALEWERGLVKSWDLLHPCSNQYCTHHWFIVEKGHNIHCPFCGAKIKHQIPILHLYKHNGRGKMYFEHSLVVYNHSSLYKWHIYDHVFANESSDRTPQAYFAFQNGQWLLINQRLSSLHSPNGFPVRPSRQPLQQAGAAIALKHQAQFWLAKEEHGLFASVEMIN